MPEKIDAAFDEIYEQFTNELSGKLEDYRVDFDEGE